MQKSGIPRIAESRRRVHIQERKTQLASWGVEPLKDADVVPLSVLLVDDNPIFLRILTRFLSEQAEGALRVVGSVIGGQDAVVEAERLHPDIILLDLAMPDVSGLAVLPMLRKRLPDAIIIALTLMDPDSARQATLAAGADAFVSKWSLERDLFPAIRRLAARESGSGHERMRPPDCDWPATRAQGGGVV